MDKTKRLGFGCMRLPMNGYRVDLKQFSDMIDRYMDAGFYYFDTARVYIGGQSETALRDCLVSRYSRERFILTDKLSGSQFQQEEEILPLFNDQLFKCGTDYFDYYLMHSMNLDVYRRFDKMHAFEIASELKKQDKIRHLGISFHDKPEVLELILNEHPEIEVVQIQLNYLDIDNPSIESQKVYEVCRKFGKPVFVMEPVKGGGLAKLPYAAEKIFAELGEASPSSYAVRYAASYEGVAMVLSGMSSLEQMEDNISYMQDFVPLDHEELKAVEDVRAILKAENSIQCTACRYCVAGCPQKILIPDILSCVNTSRRYHDWGSNNYYGVHTQNHGKASDCVKCRQCERICPQHLPITEYLREAVKLFEV